MGKLKRIKERFEILEKNVNSATEKIEELEKHKETFKELATKFNAIYDNYFLPEQEISEAEMKQQQEETVVMMKGVVREAISDMLADPKNQENIQNFIGQFSASMTGSPDGLPFDIISDKEGNVDLIRTGLKFWANSKKGDAFKGIAPTSGKTTGY